MERKYSGIIVILVDMAHYMKGLRSTQSGCKCSFAAAGSAS